MYTHAKPSPHSVQPAAAALPPLRAHSLHQPQPCQPHHHHYRHHLHTWGITYDRPHALRGAFTCQAELDRGGGGGGAHRSLRTRLSPKMENFKRCFVMWLSEGKDAVATRYFREMMIEGMAEGGGMRMPPEYRPDAQMLEEYCRTLGRQYRMQVRGCGLNRRGAVPHAGTRPYCMQAARPLCSLQVPKERCRTPCRGAACASGIEALPTQSGPTGVLLLAAAQENC
eukprot:359397-Chlamydomonas_euryale.AAC.10